MSVPVITVPGEFPASLSTAAVRATGLRKTYGRGDTAVQALAGVDVSFARGAFPAMSRLTRHGSDHGLCQTHADETWHCELSVEPVCPSPWDSAVSR